MVNINVGEMAEALYQLRKKYGLYYNPSKMEILEKAIKNKNLLS